MKKIYESPFNGWDERAEMIIIYELEEGDTKMRLGLTTKECSTIWGTTAIATTPTP